MAKRKEKDGDTSPVLRFTEDHLWLRVDADHAQIGISDYGQNSIGEVIAIELPDIGDEIEQGEPFGEIETVRTVQGLIAPVSGTVRAVNGELDDNPTVANEDPYHEGWLIEVELSDEEELDGLMSSEDYEEFLARENEE